MSHFEDIYEIAADNNGIITSAQAREAGIARSEIARWCRTGKLERIGHGAYLLAWHEITEIDPYAQAVAACGPNARLHGESVLAMLELAPTDPSRVYVAVPRRLARNLPRNVRTVPASTHETPTAYEGVPSQSALDALRSCSKTMLPERVAEAADEAARQGYITREERDEIKKSL